MFHIIKIICVLLFKFRDHFYGKEHYNYIGTEVDDVPESPVIISVMNDVDRNVTEIIVRTASGTCSEILQNSSESTIGAICEETDVLNLAKILMPDLKVQSISIIDGYQVSVLHSCNPITKNALFVVLGLDKGL